MIKPINSYTSQPIPRALQKQARMVWMIGLIAAALWVLAIVLAPILKADGITAVSGPIYNFFSHICHQMPERSPHILGHQFAVCSRCFGVYFGLVAGFLAYPFWRRIEEIDPLPRIWLFLALVPIGIDWSLGIFGIWGNTHVSRFLTGLILGFVCAVYIVPALVEIARNLITARNYRTNSPA